jgi:hypothetical protein
MTTIPVMLPDIEDPLFPRYLLLRTGDRHRCTTCHLSTG